MNTLTRWLLATLTAFLWAASGAILDGPDEHETAQAVAEDVDQAVADAKGDK